MYKIVISGPESCGKTELAGYLSKQLSSTFIPEYAREYVEKLGRPYQVEDVEHIALVQWKQYQENAKKDHPYLIMDTFLVITKIWFKEVFGIVPEWIDRCLEEAETDLYLLCFPDLEWVKDPVRENPGERRKELFDLYHNEITRLGITCEVIRGRGETRFANALSAINKLIPGLKN
jgi:nicotinamide riboside kinase